MDVGDRPVGGTRRIGHFSLRSVSDRAAKEASYLAGEVFPEEGGIPLRLPRAECHQPLIASGEV